MGSDPYALEVPQETVLENSQSELAKVQLWFETADDVQEDLVPNSSTGASLNSEGLAKCMIACSLKLMLLTIGDGVSITRTRSLKGLLWGAIMGPVIL